MRRSADKMEGAVLKMRPEFVVDRKGRRRKVILSMRDYRSLLECVEDEIDAALIEEVRDEPTVPWEEVCAKRQALRRRK
jgi:hypothetical protein